MTLAFYRKNDADISENKDELINTLPESFKTRVLRHSDEKGRTESLFASLLLFDALKKIVKEPKDYIINADEKGKPYFEGNPLFFNLSHSHGVSFCVLSDSPVGCDVEKIREVNASVSEKYFTEEEKCRDFFWVWTRKESFFKAIGTGLTLPLRSVSVTADSVSYSGKEYFFKTVVIDGYAFSVCFSDENADFIELLD